MYIPEQPNIYQGKQVIINSDRLVFNAKEDAILLSSDKAIGFNTNGSFHFDSSNHEDNKFIVNTPNIYLGLKSNGNLPSEPALLGDKTEEWMEELIDLIEGTLDDLVSKISYISTIPGTPTAPNPVNETFISVRRLQINDLRSQIKELKSKKVKLV